MTIPRLIPVLLVHENKLQKSLKFNSWTYVGDLLNTVKVLNDKDVDEIVILNTEISGPDSL
jgi:cyclase